MGNLREWTKPSPNSPRQKKSPRTYFKPYERVEKTDVLSRPSAVGPLSIVRMIACIVFRLCLRGRTTALGGVYRMSA